MDYPGHLFVVAAPSGAGKSSLVKALMELDSQVHPSISHTTRPPRGQEKHGREYYFVSATEFDEMIAKNAFVEWANVHGQRYGTSKAVLIFILPPSWEELRSRLERRGEDSPEVIELRLKNAELEVAQAKEFDFVIINESFDRALFDLKAIVHAQRLKFSAQIRNRAETFAALHIY